MTLSTHVLDATTGRPAAGVQVRLERGGDGGWVPASQGQTGADGRLRLSGEDGSLGVLRRDGVERTEGRGRLRAQVRHADIQSGPANTR